LVVVDLDAGEREISNLDQQSGWLDARVDDGVVDAAVVHVVLREDVVEDL
jgi:hypothetical protein